MNYSAEDDTPQEPETTDPSQPLLNDIQTRVLGALMEKQLTTPDAYPLTVNSLITACNQKTSREPVSNYQQGDVVRALRELENQRYVKYEMGSRSDRYAQSLTHELGLSKNQQALMCVMMLRGPQTVNELQSRTQRMVDFSDRETLLLSLERLTQGDNPYVTTLPHQSGKREDRYGHLLSGTPKESINATAAAPIENPGSGELDELRNEVAQLREQLFHLYTLTGFQKPDSD